jgi:hypothetical protein
MLHALTLVVELLKLDIIPAVYGIANVGDTVNVDDDTK